jgi:hypothetical protein
MRNGTAMPYEPPAPVYDDGPESDAESEDPAEWAPEPETDAGEDAENDVTESGRQQNADDILRELLGESAQTGGSRFAEPDEEETDDGTGE